MRRKIGIMMLGLVLLVGFAVNIQAARPTVTISALPTTIVAGSSLTLIWTSTGATSASINNNIGSVAVNGFQVVTPTKTTTYTITAKNSSGSTTARATITVKVALPTVSFSAAPATIAPGVYTIKAYSAEYQVNLIPNVNVEKNQTSPLDIALIKRESKAGLNGILKDYADASLVPGATITLDGTTQSTVTDQNGYFTLSEIPAGLNRFRIEAPGYLVCYRSIAVTVDIQASGSQIVNADMAIDKNDPDPVKSVTKQINAVAGGTVVSADGRMELQILPDSLSGDAVITLSEPGDGPALNSGDYLSLNSSVGLDGIKALGKVSQITISSVNENEQPPIIQGGALLMLRYSQSEIDQFAMAENSAMPYFFNGTNWELFRNKPGEFAVDKINNLVIAAVDLNTTSTGAPAAHGNYITSKNVSNSLYKKIIKVIIGLASIRDRS